MSDDTFSATRCTRTPANVGVNAFSRFWTLAATWDTLQELPNVDGFVSQQPYWQSCGRMAAYHSDRAALAHGDARSRPGERHHPDMRSVHRVRGGGARPPDPLSGVRRQARSRCVIQTALLSLMATLDHGPVSGTIQTCEAFIEYAAAAHGRPIHFPECDAKHEVDACEPNEFGLHAIVVIGYYFAGFHRPLEESYFHIVNSYGLGWGVEGRARLAMGHFQMSQFSLPLIRDPQRLVNPFLPAIDPSVAYSLPPTRFLRSTGLGVAVNANKLAIFPLDNNDLTLDVTKMLPDVAIATITFQFTSPVPADLRASLSIAFTNTPSNRLQLQGVGVSTFRYGSNANAIVFVVPQEAAKVPASSWWAAVSVRLQSNTASQLQVQRITYTIDANKSGAFLTDDTLKKDSAAMMGIATSVIVAAIATIVAM